SKSNKRHLSEVEPRLATRIFTTQNPKSERRSPKEIRIWKCRFAAMVFADSVFGFPSDSRDSSFGFFYCNHFPKVGNPSCGRGITCTLTTWPTWADAAAPASVAAFTAA